MRHRRVVTLDAALDLDFPVALVQVFVDAAATDQNLAHRREVHVQIDEFLDAAEFLVERDVRLGQQAREDDAAVVADPRRRHEVQLVLVDLAGVVAPRHGDGGERPVEAEFPAVVRAGEAPRVALFGCTNGGTAVHAAVDQHVYLAGQVTTDDDRHQADERRLVIARIRNLAFVRHVHPGAVEDALHLVVEHLGVGVEADVRAVHAREIRVIARSVHAASPQDSRVPERR